MSKVTDTELDGIREAQADFMPQSVVIRRKDFIADGAFQQINVAIEVPARIVPGFGYWRSVADRFQGITPFRITVPWDQEIAAGYTVVDEESRVYEVRDVLAPATYQTAKQVLTDLVTDG